MTFVRDLYGKYGLLCLGIGLIFGCQDKHIEKINHPKQGYIEEVRQLNKLSQQNNLDSLILQYQDLDSIPDLSGYPHLTYLDLSGNCITSFNELTLLT